MNISRAIRTCRHARGLSQLALAAEVGISASYLSSLESGRKEPSLPLLRRIAAALDLPIDLVMLTAIDYVELNKRHPEMSELFGQMMMAIATRSRDR